MRKTIALTAILAVLPSSVFASSTALRYQIEFVGIGRDEEGQLNDNGAVLADQRGSPYIWQSGQTPTPTIAPIAGYERATPTGINNSGAYTGYFSRRIPGLFDSESIAYYVDSAGALHTIDSVDHFRSNNNSDQAVGSTHDGTIIVWSRSSGLTTVGKVAHENFTFGLSINDTGSVTGYGVTRNFGEEWTSTPYRWDELNGMTYLPGRNGSASDINNNGEIVGEVDQRSGGSYVSHAAYWGSDNSLTILPQPLGSTSTDRSQAYAINDSGLIVGESDNIGATLWFDGEVYDLNNLVDANELAQLGVSLDLAVDINNAGQILTHALTDQSGAMVFHQYLLTPIVVPVPATAWLFLSSIVGLFSFRKAVA